MRSLARAIAVGVAVAAAAERARAEETRSDSSIEPVRVVYDAPSDCPSEDAFLGQVRARIGTAWEAPPNALARTIEVHVTSGPSRSVARIGFVDENRQPIRRVVTAPTCDEVVSGIALVTALAIESRVAEAVGKSEPELVPPDAAPAGPSATAQVGAVSPSVPSAPEARARPAPKSDRRAESRLHFEIGTAAAVATGTGPNAAWGPRGFVGLGFASGVDLRLGFDALDGGTANQNGREARFSLLDGRVTGCPFALGLTGGTRLLPCAGAEVGVLRAEGERSTLVENADTKTRGWVTPFVGLRFDAAYRVLFFEVEGAVRFPLFQQDFVFEDAALGNVRFWSIPPAAVGLSIGVGLRL